MPEKLKKFLEGLNNHDAAIVWVWIDGNPDAIFEMSETIVQSHYILGVDDRYDTT